MPQPILLFAVNGPELFHVRRRLLLSGGLFIEVFVFPVFRARDGGLERHARICHLIDLEQIATRVRASFLGGGGAFVARFGRGISFRCRTANRCR